MSSTITEIDLDDAAPPSGRSHDAPVPPVARRLWPALTWVAVISVAVAAAVLVVSVLRTDSPSINPDNVRTIAEHGSISAIEHRDELVLGASHTPAQTVAEHGSISAIDNRESVAGEP